VIYPVLCWIIEAINASEISFAENVVREDMYLADQFEAFRNLVDARMFVADVAVRFGKIERNLQEEPILPVDAKSEHG